VEVQSAIFAANRLNGKPYRYGGGHGRWEDRGYDCSGTVSYALHGAGLLASPLDSGSFMRWGQKGPGQWISIYTNRGHAYAVIAGLRLDTSVYGFSARRGKLVAKTAYERGPRWRPSSRPSRGFRVRHPLNF
jgi:cell wall-associated NlpC family hydrolase